MKQAVISVLGGVAEVAYASDDVDVTIVDFDNDPHADLESVIDLAKAGEEDPK